MNKLGNSYFKNSSCFVFYAITASIYLGDFLRLILFLIAIEKSVQILICTLCKGHFEKKLFRLLSINFLKAWLVQSYFVLCIYFHLHNM